MKWLIFLLFLIPGITLAEEYEPTILNDFYYLDETEIYGVFGVSDPTVCAMDFEDHLMPEGTNDYLMEITAKSVKKWEKALEDYTLNENVWNINFEVIPMNEQYKTEEIDERCEVIIYFEPQYVEWLWEEMGIEPLEALGVTDNLGPVSDIYILYRDVVYEELEIEIINDYGELESWYEYEPLYHSKEIPYDIEETITHEIGHAFSLDHKPVFWENFYEKDGIMFSDSIMGEPDKIPVWYEDEVGYEITEYDIQAIVQLYGENGFIPDSELGFAEGLFDMETKTKPVNKPQIIEPQRDQPLRTSEMPTLMQATLKENIEKFPEHFPYSYILYLDSRGLIIE